jgi:hypothetical protein
MDRPYFLETTLVVTSGWYTSPVGNLDLLIWLQGSNAGASGPETRGEVVLRNRRDNSISMEFSTHAIAVSHLEIERLLTGLRELQFPGRRPRVEAVVDTSDVWTNASLHIRELEREGSFHLCLAGSGYEGDDAERLERVLLAILTAAHIDLKDYPATALLCVNHTVL